MVEDMRTNKALYYKYITHAPSKKDVLYELSNTTNPCFLHVRKRNLNVAADNDFSHCYHRDRHHHHGSQ